MRDKWYSDNHDLVKWSVLLILARKFHVDRILQIAYYRRSEYPPLEINGNNHEIPFEVLSYLRKVQNITSLSLQPKISVFDMPLEEDRTSYLREVTSFLEAFHEQRCIIFLDPDTGLEPARSPGPQHVLNEEVRSIWEALPNKWVMVFYQHKTARNSQPWTDQKREQFAKAIQVPLEDVKKASGMRITSNVVFFYAQKKIRTFVDQ